MIGTGRVNEKDESIWLVKSGDRVCLKTEADAGNLGRVLLPPLLIASGYRFTLEQAPCPSAAELAGYKRVDIDYQSK